MWHRFGSLSIMSLEQLIFTWKRQHLVLTLFASIFTLVLTLRQNLLKNIELYLKTIEKIKYK